MVRKARCHSQQEVSQVDEGSSPGNQKVEKPDHYYLLAKDVMVEALEDMQSYFGEWSKEPERFYLEYMLPDVLEVLDSHGEDCYTIKVDVRVCGGTFLPYGNFKLYFHDRFAEAQFKLMYASQYKSIKENHERTVDRKVSAQQGSGLCVPRRSTAQSGNWLAQQWRNAASVIQRWTRDRQDHAG